MLLPKLAPSVIRRTSAGRSSPGVRLSKDEFFASCTCVCENGNSVCGNGSGLTLADAQAAAHSAASNLCTSQGSSVKSSTYTTYPCPS